MLGRILRVLLLMLLAGFVVHRLFSREQKHTIHYWVRVFAYSLLAVSALMLIWRLMQYFWMG